MTSLYLTVDSAIWYIICCVSLTLLAGSISILIRIFLDSRKLSARVFAFINTLFAFLVFVILMDCSRYVSPVEDRPFSSFQAMLFDLPWYFYAGVEVVNGVLLLICFRDNVRYRKEYLTGDAVIDAINLLPEGISISDMSGSVRLANLKMNDLCKALTGENYIDAKRFWNYVADEGKEQGGTYLLRTPDDRVWIFEKDRLESDGNDLEQITATDVTERFKIIDELEAKKEHLEDIQKRMKAVTDLSGDMFVAQEEADARAALHNQLGQVLLMGRYYIEHKESTDPEMVYLATKQMNQFLLGESGTPYRGEEEELALAVNMAGSIGVKVVIEGEAPKNSKIRKILADAVTECAANTVKHAEGDTVNIDISKDSKTVIVITNNGKPPKGAVTESGGLLSLRKSVEEEGGSMRIESNGAFRLIMEF